MASNLLQADRTASAAYGRMLGRPSAASTGDALRGAGSCSTTAGVPFITPLSCSGSQMLSIKSWLHTTAPGDVCRSVPLIQTSRQSPVKRRSLQSFVFGERALNQPLASTSSECLQSRLRSAYSYGRNIRSRILTWYMDISTVMFFLWLRTFVPYVNSPLVLP